MQYQFGHKVGQLDRQGLENQGKQIKINDRESMRINGQQAKTSGKPIMKIKQKQRKACKILRSPGTLGPATGILHWSCYCKSPELLQEAGGSQELFTRTHAAPHPEQEAK